MKKLATQKSHPKWVLFLVFLPVLLIAILPFIPADTLFPHLSGRKLRFWKADYLLFLSVMMFLPVFLLKERSRFVRLMSFLPVLLAVAMIFLPKNTLFPHFSGKSLHFWDIEYILFLLGMIVLSIGLYKMKSQTIRAFVILASLAYFGFMQNACPRPPGAIEQILLHLTDKKPIIMHVIKIALLMVTGLIFARYYCGWVCPKGVIQEYIYRPQFKYKIPPKVDRILKYGKYVMLALLILMPLLFHIRFMRKTGPFKVIFNLDGTIITLSILIVVLVASMFIERAFCRYLCPEGALLALISIFSPLKIRADKDSCSGCRKCDKVCPTDAITVKGRGDIEIAITECITCKNCETVCPGGGIFFGAKPTAEQSTEPVAEKA